eukprot:m.11172 g.11172  ORF g.11172 m.11172 type:complete len:356 (-) comp8691_c0_seq1:159-1226(-)
MGAQTSRVPLPDHTIKWHRTKVDPKVFLKVHAKSDVQGFIQTLGILGMLAVWFGLALHYHAVGRNGLSALFVSLYGMQANFLINGMHELGHGSVFKTKWLNGFFLRVISFFGWLHPDMFFSSHLRHHRYTQNFPFDQENPQPVIITLSGFLKFGFVNVQGCYDVLKQTVRAAFAMYPTLHLWWTAQWEDVCYPPGNDVARVPAKQWAQVMLLGHAVIDVWAIANGLYLIPLMITFGPFYNGWLFFLCNASQHVGLDHGTSQRPVTDFRLTTRTFYVNNPLVQFWYWHMNYHIEHHMYAAVPCYHLAELHNAIKHDLPPTPNGFVELWTSIGDIMAKQTADADYVHEVSLPETKSK